MVLNTESGATMGKVTSLALKIAEMIEGYRMKGFLRRGWEDAVYAVRDRYTGNG